jgi:uncharacterized protein (DUF1684 family)
VRDRQEHPAQSAGPGSVDAVDALSLADFRARVAALYQSDVDLTGFRRGRDELFRAHPQSPIPAAERETFDGLRYFEPDGAFVAEVPLRPAEGSMPVDTGGADGVIRYERVGILDTPWGELTLWWLAAYGGGLFLPFRDGTCGTESYGGGRYLTDTIKGTHGRGVVPVGGRVRLDFNYAYNPSCAYDAAWLCPLAPPENRVAAQIRAGEQAYGR